MTGMTELTTSAYFWSSDSSFSVTSNTYIHVETVSLFQGVFIRRHLKSEFCSYDLKDITGPGQALAWPAMTLRISQGQGKPLHDPEYRCLLLASPPHLLHPSLGPSVISFGPSKHRQQHYPLSCRQSWTFPNQFWRSYEGLLDHIIFLTGFGSLPHVRRYWGKYIGFGDKGYGLKFRFWQEITGGI